MRKKPLPLVVVEWVDSSSLAGGTWKDSDEVADTKPILIRSVGWVAREDRDSIVLVAHIAPHQSSGDLCIPKSAIEHRRKLSDPKRKRR